MDMAPEGVSITDLTNKRCNNPHWLCLLTSTLSWLSHLIVVALRLNLRRSMSYRYWHLCNGFLKVLSCMPHICFLSTVTWARQVSIFPCPQISGPPPMRTQIPPHLPDFNLFANAWGSTISNLYHNINYILMIYWCLLFSETYYPYVNAT